MFIKILVAGFVILIVAILANIVALKAGVSTWYPFLNEVSKMGFAKAFVETSLVSKIFLFIIYPLLLGLSAFIVLEKIK